MIMPTGSFSHLRRARGYKRALDRVAESTYGRLRRLIPDPQWLLLEPLIARIERLKIERNAVILAHNYQTPEIFHGVADYQGDSLSLAHRDFTNE